MSTGVVLPFEHAAIKGDPMPDGLDIPDQVMFIALRGLYHQAKAGTISRETAVQEKKNLLNGYKQMKWYKEQSDLYVKTIKDTEAARSAYRKNRTIENADAMLIAFDGIS